MWDWLSFIGRHRIYTDSHTHDHLHNVKYSTYMRSAWWANQNIHLLYDLLARGSMTVKITFTRYEKYVHVTLPGFFSSSVRHYYWRRVHLCDHCLPSDGGHHLISILDGPPAATSLWTAPYAPSRGPAPPAATSQFSFMDAACIAGYWYTKPQRPNP